MMTLWPTVSPSNAPVLQWWFLHLLLLQGVWNRCLCFLCGALKQVKLSVSLCLWWLCFCRMGTRAPGQHSAADSAVNLGLASCPELGENGQYWVQQAKWLQNPPPLPGNCSPLACCRGLPEVQEWDHGWRLNLTCSWGPCMRLSLKPYPESHWWALLNSRVLLGRCRDHPCATGLLETPGTQPGCVSCRAAAWTAPALVIDFLLVYVFWKILILLNASKGLCLGTSAYKGWDLLASLSTKKDQAWLSDGTSETSA